MSTAASCAHATSSALMAGGRSWAEKDGRTLIHLNRLGFRLDGMPGSSDPRGMAARQLSPTAYGYRRRGARPQPAAGGGALLPGGSRARRRALCQRHRRHQRGGAPPRRHLHRYRWRDGNGRRVRRGPLHSRRHRADRRSPHHVRHRARIADATCGSRANQDAIWHNDCRSVGRARGLFLCACGRGRRGARS